jgi:hypothetical protein
MCSPTCPHMYLAASAPSALAAPRTVFPRSSHLPSGTPPPTLEVNILSPAHIEGEGVTQRYKGQEMGEDPTDTHLAVIGRMRQDWIQRTSGAVTREMSWVLWHTPIILALGS